MKGIEQTSNRNIKYKKKFNEDFNFYLRNRSIFNFDGANKYTNKKGIEVIQYDINGIDAKKAFYLYDSNGQINKTKHPNILKSLLKTKGSVNLHIKMYAEDRAKGYLPKIEFNKIVNELNLPNWFVDAVEKQKSKYYE